MQKTVFTHVITGFLGVGKTTAIQYLLRHKPAAERWAVLVNEFGEIGIDGAMLAGSGATIKEIPGGCLCCVNGLPMQVGLNQLLKTRPDRLLIEPTGLGHPQNILDLLAGPEYHGVLEVRAALCLVDARKVDEPRYRENETFRAQLQSADTIIANKADLCDQRQRQVLEEFLAGLSPARRVDAWVEQGAIDPRWLDGEHAGRPAAAVHAHAHGKPVLPLELPPGETLLRRENHGSGHFSCGWLFAPEASFDFARLFGLCSGLVADRLKAVVNTGRGTFAFNAENGVLSVLDAEPGGESRIEVIHREALDWDGLEAQLRAALSAAPAH